MILEIKKVRTCKNPRQFGYFVARGQERGYIAISEKKNPTLDRYAATLLHELLHFYIALLKAEGFKVGSRKEHAWIYRCEAVIISLMQKYFTGR